MTVKELDTYGKTVDEILEEIKVLVGGKWNAENYQLRTF
jgi:hypothetical protein